MLSFPAVACTVRLGRPCFFFPGRSRSRIPTPSGPGPKVSAIRPPFMCAFCIPCASPGLPRPVVPQSIPTSRPPIRATVRAIPNAQHRGASGLTPLFATLPENPPVSLIIATLPKSCSRNSFVCHTYETPPGGYPPQTFAPIHVRGRSRSPDSTLVPRFPAQPLAGIPAFFRAVSCVLSAVSFFGIVHGDSSLFHESPVTNHQSPQLWYSPTPTAPFQTFRHASLSLPLQ